MTHRFGAARAEAALRELLIGVGEDPDRPGLKDPPARVARAYTETFAGLWQDPGDVLATTFDEDHDELVLSRKSRCNRPASTTWWPSTATRTSGTSPGWTGGGPGRPNWARWAGATPRAPRGRSGG